jgi:thiol:disulfide interchange protein DsbA
MVVNGKYLINSKALDDKNFFADYTALVAHLFTL